MQVASRIQLVGPLNVTILTHVAFIVSDVAQGLIIINTSSKGVHLKFGYKICEFEL